MASRSETSMALLLSLNLLFFSLVSSTSCPVGAPKLKVCADLLGLVSIPPDTPCCNLLGNLAAAEAALCLCAAIRVNALGIHLNVPLDVNLLLNNCGKEVPEEFTCP
ncbi:lipid binding protein, putative [Ricinus communis]|uniref:Lipid binding protein, putative n=1 Tax=Ricinus communis TaxID=3988 RepID=B9RHD2_RICCO|nr:lipid binding protein, putative [Ricinus communis]|eukprot:XP_002512991.3 14 kDa proline-rich protein DC2.15 [Ricinus communis]